MTLLIAPLFIAGLAIGNFQAVDAGGPPPEPDCLIDVGEEVNLVLAPGEASEPIEKKITCNFEIINAPVFIACDPGAELGITFSEVEGTGTPMLTFLEHITLKSDPGEPVHCAIDFEVIGQSDTFSVTQTVWIDPPPPPLETEKFYTDTNVNFKKGKLGEPLPFRDGTFVFGTEDSQVVKAVVDRNGKIKSYNPGQYIAVTKVTALEDLASVWITEDDRDCTEKTGISQMNPNEVPGGAYVALMCPDEKVEDLSGELAKSGNLFINDKTGIVEAHIEDVPEGCMVFLGVKYSPGLKGQVAEEVPLENRSCENWEDVEAVTLDGTTFTDSAHRVLEVTGFPELNVVECGCQDPPINSFGCGEFDCEVELANCEALCDVIPFFECRPVDACFPF